MVGVMRDTPEGIVEELRLTARLEALELGIEPAEMTAAEAADHIEYLRAFLQRIADGETPAVGLAAEALDPMLWASSGKS